MPVGASFFVTNKCRYAKDMPLLENIAEIQKPSK
jgi:hypothetical protein